MAAKKITEKEAFERLGRMVSDLDYLAIITPDRGFKRWSDRVVGILRQLPWSCKKGRVNLVMAKIAEARLEDRWIDQYRIHCSVVFLLLSCIRMYAWWWDEDD